MILLIYVTGCVICTILLCIDERKYRDIKLDTFMFILYASALSWFSVFVFLFLCIRDIPNFIVFKKKD